MKSLDLMCVQELTEKEICNVEGGWVGAALRIAQAIATAAVAVNEACDQCITKRIAESDGSLGGSRPFE